LGGLIATAVSLWFTGPLQDLHAQVLWDDDAEAVVRGMLTDLRAAGAIASTPEEHERATAMAHARATSDIPAHFWSQWDVGADPYVWTGLRLDSGDETREHASVGPADGGPWVLRRAKSGCWELRGDFELVRTRGAWRIKRLPKFGGRCRGDELRATWTHSDLTRGVIDWSGTYQRIDPLRAAYSNTSLLKENTNFNRSWRIEKSFDVAVPDKGRGRLPVDGTVRTAWGADGPLEYVTTGARSWGTLTYTFPADVQLLRIRLHNGVRARNAGYADFGRIKHATIRAGGRVVDAFLKSRLGSQRIDCFFGPVNAVSITIRDVYPAKDASPAVSDVALSQIDFWGMERGARVADVGTGPFAWSGLDPTEHQEDIAPCRDDAPPPELQAEPTPAPILAASSAPTPTTGGASINGATPDPGVASPSPQSLP
jgi:hypothetical protein